MPSFDERFGRAPWWSAPALTPPLGSPYGGRKPSLLDGLAKFGAPQAPQSLFGYPGGPASAPIGILPWPSGAAANPFSASTPASTDGFRSRLGSFAAPVLGLEQPTRSLEMPGSSLFAPSFASQQGTTTQSGPALGPEFYEALQQTTAQLRALNILRAASPNFQNVAAPPAAPEPFAGPEPAAAPASAPTLFEPALPSSLSPTGSTSLSPDLFVPAPFWPTERPGFPSNWPGLTPGMPAPFANPPAPGGQTQEFLTHEGDPLNDHVIAENSAAELPNNSDDTRQAAVDRAGDAPRAEPFSRSYERALATIDADPDLRREVAAIAKAGDADFRNRFATIIANLEHDRGAAHDAIRRETFRTQLSNRAAPTGANITGALAMWRAFDRLAELQPDVGVVDARELGFRPVVNMDYEQRRQLWSAWRNPHLTEEEKGRLNDIALAIGLTGAFGSVLRGRLFAPDDRLGAGPIAPRASIGRTPPPLLADLKGQVQAKLDRLARKKLGELDPANPLLQQPGAMKPSNLSVRALNNEIERVIKEKGIVGLEGHHNLAQQFRGRWKRYLPDVDIHDYVTYMDVGDHRLRPNGLHTGPNHWNKQLEEFFQKYQNPRPEQIFEKMNEMIDGMIDQLGKSRNDWALLVT